MNESLKGLASNKLIYIWFVTSLFKFRVEINQTTFLSLWPQLADIWIRWCISTQYIKESNFSCLGYAVSEVILPKMNLDF